MRFQVVVEYDPGTRHYTATVAGIPAIVVDAKSQRTAVKLATEAITMYREARPKGERLRSGPRSKPVRARLVTVQV